MYAHFALQKLKIRIKDFAEMDDRERASTIASIDLRIEDEKKNK